MTGQEERKLTPLHRAHLLAGARMVDFAGWQMPVQYTSLIEEHRAVRTRAGLFDVSHMGELAVRGPEALHLLQGVTSNDVSRLTPGRVQYSALTTENGGFVDDLLVYRLGADEYMLVVNAANIAKDFAWLEYHAKGLQVELTDRSEAWGQIALQGPRAQEILEPLARADLGTLKYYAFVQAEVDGVPCLVSRTGYTGEDGFEVYAPADRTEKLWYAILGAGAPHGLVPVGLGARDTLRLEAKMALYGNDIDETTSVLEADLAWILKLDKGPFIGCEVLRRQREQGVSRRIVGFEMLGRAIARHGHSALCSGEPVGTVTSGCPAPYLKKNIGLTYLPRGMWEPGTRFEVDVRGRREPAVVVPTPFYKRSR